LAQGEEVTRREGTKHPRPKICKRTQKNRRVIMHTEGKRGGIRAYIKKCGGEVPYKTIKLGNARNSKEEVAFTKNPKN